MPLGQVSKSVWLSKDYIDVPSLERTPQPRRVVVCDVAAGFRDVVGVRVMLNCSGAL